MPLGALTELFGVGNSLPEERERNWVTLKVYGSPFFIGFPALISLRKARTHGAARGKRPRCSDADTLSCIYFVRECEISCQTHIAGGRRQPTHLLILVWHGSLSNMSYHLREEEG